MVFLATYATPAFAVWAFAWFWFELPWYLSPLPAFLAFPAGFLVWVIRLRVARLPALDPHTYRATVVEHTLEVYDQEDGYERTNLHVRVDTPDGGFDSVLADNVADEDLHRFHPSSTWSVRVFADTTARVFLSDAHDDVLRSGYHLDGIRHPGEHTQRPRPKPGSPLARKRFRT
ncbi:hypothetical protein [Actinophytocola sp. NPDC049390]|uniref:hypothetical protein n=1 Tax=Actinophytocola sp. NPDC049390 TaxID=3363894 RepID=UPI0037AE934B